MLENPRQQATTTVVDVTSTSSVKSYVEAKALENGVSPDLASYIVKNESGFCQNQLGDMKIYGKNGKPIRARGCWQITEYYHPDISDMQAFDLVFSTDWAMKYLKDKRSCMGMWSTCRDYYLGKIKA